MENLTICKQCGFSEPNDTMSNGVCYECISENERFQSKIAKQKQKSKNSISLDAIDFIFTLIFKIFGIIKVCFVILFIAVLVKLLITAFDGKKVRYSVRDTSIDTPFLKATWDGSSPKFFTLNPTSYKLVGNIVVSETAGSLRSIEPPDCTIMDLSNWQCIWIEDYYSGGTVKKQTFLEEMNDGDYSFASSRWSFEEIMNVNQNNDVGALRYHIVGCTGDFYEGFLNGLIMCPLRFAFYYP